MVIIDIKYINFSVLIDEKIINKAVKNVDIFS